MTTARRWPILVVLGGLLVAVLLVGGEGTEPAGVFGRRAAAGAGMPVSSPASSLSSTWFCPAATSTGSGAAEGLVTILNVGDRDLTGTVTAYPNEGEPAALAFDLMAHSRLTTRLVDLVRSDLVATLVEVSGGEVVVELSAGGPTGREATPCATTASDHWYLPSGVTTRDARQILTLFNPFPDDAIADLSFATDQGAFSPQPLQALVVPTGRVVGVDLTQHVRRRQHVATTLVARSGRLVMGHIQTWDGSGVPPEGLVVGLAAPSPAMTWYFPDGQKGDGLAERYHVYNPTEEEAVVDVELTLDSGFAEPFELTIPPRSYQVVDASADERIPPGVAHAAVVRSANDVPVVADRLIHAGRGANRRGSTVMLGSRRAARRWALAVGKATSALDEWILLQNPGRRQARVGVVMFSSGRRVELLEPSRVRVAANGRLGVRVAGHVQADDLPLVIESDQPIVVERALIAIDEPGVYASIGIPLSD